MHLTSHMTFPRPMIGSPLTCGGIVVEAAHTSTRSSQLRIITPNRLNQTHMKITSIKTREQHTSNRGCITQCSQVLRLGGGETVVARAHTSTRSSQLRIITPNRLNQTHMKITSIKTREQHVVCENGFSS